MLAACACRAGAFGESVLGALKLVDVPLELVDMSLKDVHPLKILRQLAAVLGQELGTSLVAAVVLFLKTDDSGDLLQRKSESLKLDDAFEIHQVLIRIVALAAACTLVLMS